MLFVIWGDFALISTVAMVVVMDAMFVIFGGKFNLQRKFNFRNQWPLSSLSIKFGVDWLCLAVARVLLWTSGFPDCAITHIWFVHNYCIG